MEKMFGFGFSHLSTKTFGNNSKQLQKLLPVNCPAPWFSLFFVVGNVTGCGCCLCILNLERNVNKCTYEYVKVYMYINKWYICKCMYICLARDTPRKQNWKSRSPINASFSAVSMSDGMDACWFCSPFRVARLSCLSCFEAPSIVSRDS